MNIQKLTPKDAARFQRLRLIGLRDEPSAFADGELVGVVALGREGMRKLAHKGYVWGMFVAASARRQGAGRLLMSEVISMAGGVPGLRQLNLGVNANNASAIRLYESLGFEAFGMEADAMLIDGTMHDEVHMSLRLLME